MLKFLKKKKKQQTIPLETTNEEHEKSDTASQAEIELSSDKPEVVESSLTPINKPSASAIIFFFEYLVR